MFLSPPPPFLHAAAEMYGINRTLFWQYLVTGIETNPSPSTGDRDVQEAFKYITAVLNSHNVTLPGLVLELGQQWDEMFTTASTLECQVCVYIKLHICNNVARNTLQQAVSGPTAATSGRCGPSRGCAGYKG